MFRLVRLLGVIPALGGFAAACLLVPDGKALQVPTVPTVTVTTPTVSVPAPVPVPSTPTATVTVAPPTVPPPPTTAPVPAPSPPPVRIAPPPPPSTPSPTTAVPVPAPGTSGPVRTSPSPSPSPSPAPAPAPAQGGSASSPAAGGGSGSGGSSGSGGTQAGSGSTGGVVSGVAGVATTRRGSASPTGSRPLAARPHRTKNRVSVRLRFALPVAGRLFLIVRGPAPSCRVAGVVPLRGRRGANTVYFAGRVHGRRLDPGIYRLSLSTTRRPEPGAPATAVRVVSTRRSVPVAKPGLLASCTPAQAYFDDGTRRILVSEAVVQDQQRRQRPTASVAGLPTVKLQPQPKGGTAAGRDDELAGGLLPDPGDVGGDSSGGGLESFAAVFVLLIVASLLFGMVVLVARFLRGNWNP